MKPNFVAGRNAETGATTSFTLLKAVAEEVRACGAEPVLCETPGTEFDRDAIYTILGVEKFCAENGILIVRVDPEGGEQDWVELRPEGAKRLRHFRIPRILSEALEQIGKPLWKLVGEDVGVIKKYCLPQQNTFYRFIFWMMYPLDYPYTWIAERGKHLCTTLYSTGLVGTRPKIKEEICTRCGVCVEACPLPNVIDLKALKVDYRTCQRCLLCYDACPEKAISVKGYSGARQ